MLDLSTGRNYGFQAYPLTLCYILCLIAWTRKILAKCFITYSTEDWQMHLTLGFVIRYWQSPWWSIGVSDCLGSRWSRVRIPASSVWIFFLFFVCVPEKRFSKLSEICIPAGLCIPGVHSIVLVNTLWGMFGRSSIRLGLTAIFKLYVITSV